MTCLYCGKRGENLLCSNCTKIDIFDEIFNQLIYYREDKCENKRIIKYVKSFDDVASMKMTIPNMINIFESNIMDYYWCKYFYVVEEDKFEDAAIEYLDKHNIKDKNTQVILKDLLKYYIPDDYERPGKWCEIIRNEEGLYFEIYEDAANYYACIGDYDIAKSIVDKMLKYSKDKSYNKYLFCDRNCVSERIEKTYTKIERYKTKKPYWPNTESRRRMIARFYDERGIEYPRIEPMPKKVSESDFKKIKECNKERISTYCAFWCESCFTYNNVKSIYQIAAVKVKNGKITDRFESFIKPWDGVKARKIVSKRVGVTEEYLDSCDDVDIVMKKFFAFVENDVLISTDALGEQAKLIKRLARYSGMNEIKNEFLDLIDIADDRIHSLRIGCSNRDTLLESFHIKEGRDALEKAKNNIKIYFELDKYKK